MRDSYEFVFLTDSDDERDQSGSRPPCATANPGKRINFLVAGKPRKSGDFGLGFENLVHFP
jgi:hypothetical protein